MQEADRYSWVEVCLSQAWETALAGGEGGADEAFMVEQRFMHALRLANIFRLMDDMTERLT